MRIGGTRDQRIIAGLVAVNTELKAAPASGTRNLSTRLSLTKAPRCGSQFLLLCRFLSTLISVCVFVGPEISPPTGDSSAFSLAYLRRLRSLLCARRSSCYWLTEVMI